MIKFRAFASCSVAAAVAVATMSLAPTAQAAPGESTGPDCEWYGSASGGYESTTKNNDNASSHESATVTSVPAPAGCVADLSLRADTSVGGDCPTTQTASYDGGGTYAVYLSTAFHVYYYADSDPQMTRTSCDGTTTYTQSLNSFAGCDLPPAVQEKIDTIQAVVLDCSTTETASDGSSTLVQHGSVRMRRTDCDTTVDSDGDRLGDCREFVLGTETVNRDTDGDGLEDGFEVLEFGSDPLKVDTDGETLTDFDEWQLGTDPRNVDTDGDGTTDNTDKCPLDPQNLCTNECDGGTFHYSTLEAKAELVAARLPDPDLGTLALGVRWCLTDHGAFIQRVPTQSVEDNANWVFLGALENAGVVLHRTPAEAAYSEHVAYVQSKFTLQLSPLVLLSDFIPTGKVIGALGKKFNVFASKLADLNKALQRATGKAEKAQAKAEIALFEKKIARQANIEIRLWLLWYGEALKDAMDKAIAEVPFGHKRLRTALHGMVDATTTELSKSATRVFRPARLIPHQGKQVITELFLKLVALDLPMWDGHISITVSDEGEVAYSDNSRSHLPFTIKSTLTHD